LRTGPAPFGEQVWDHARQLLARRGQDPATEAEIAQAAEALLDEAEHGPGKPAQKVQKVAGRDRAVSAAGHPLPKPQPQSLLEWDDADDEDAGQLAEVIPLGVFDAHEEAKKWW
jgi:putative transposase